MENLPSPTTLAAPLFVAAVAWEWWAVKTGRAGGAYETKDAITSMAMGLGNVIVNTATGLISLWMLMLFWPYRVYELPVTWWSFILVFIAYDLLYYWKHRWAHRIRWFWAEHVTHHSSQHYNLTTALRQPWFGPFTGLIVAGAPLIILGVHPAFLFFVGGLNLIYQFWIHTEAIDRMPRWFEAVFNTPSHHRVHHATNARYLDANYAGVLIIWDRMFGTFVPELDEEKPNYGIVKQLGSFNPLWVALHEVVTLLKDCASDGFRPHHWVMRFTQPPGWSPDGNHQRTEDIKREYVAVNPEHAGEPGLPKV